MIDTDPNNRINVGSQCGLCLFGNTIRYSTRNEDGTYNTNNKLYMCSAYVPEEDRLDAYWLADKLEPVTPEEQRAFRQQPGMRDVVFSPTLGEEQVFCPCYVCRYYWAYHTFDPKVAYENHIKKDLDAEIAASARYADE